MKIDMFGYIWTIQEVLLTIAVIILIITNIITLKKYLSLISKQPKKELNEFDKTQKTIRILIITVIIAIIGILIILFIANLPKIMLINPLHQCGGDDGHFVDLVGIAATGQVIDGSSQTLQDGAQSFVAAQTLCDLVADVASLDGGEDEGVIL